MKKSKLFAVVVTVLAILLIIPFTASAEAAEKDGWYTDKGYYEYFDNGYQYKDGEYWITEYQSYFRFDADGKMLNNEWYQNPDSLFWYYYQSGGYRADDCTVKINGYYYGFDSSGIMYNDTDFSIYDINTGAPSYYIAQKGGPLVVNQWVWCKDLNYYKGGYWKYFGADGKAYTGIEKIGNSYYYFLDDGVMLEDDTAGFFDEESQTDRYVRAKKGGALYYKEWYKSEGGIWYYYNDKAIAAKGLTKVGSATYYFTGDGWMLEDSVYYNDADTSSYYADKNGHATKLNYNGWTFAGNDWYYCVDGQFLYNQMKQIGSAYYYFLGDGTMLDNQPYGWYDEENSSFCEVRAKKGGALYCGGWYLDAEDNYSYYGYDCLIVRNGFKTIGSSLFYFENSYAVRNQIIELYDGVYTADNSCAVTKRTDGWFRFNGDFYYVLNDQLVYDDMLEIGGYKYIFDDSGKMKSDTITLFYNYDESSLNYYLLAEDGKVVTDKGWYAYKGDWYYINNDNSLYEGYLEISGNTYYLSPAMAYSVFDYTWEYDYTGEHTYLYLLAPDGSYQKITKDGYYNTNFGRVLVENGELFSGWKNINGKFYYFDYAMACNTVSVIPEEESFSVYYFDNTGVMQSGGWIPYANTYLYADAYGRLVDGVQSISGKSYLFNTYMLAYDSYANIEGDIYVSDENGIATALSYGDGWKVVNNHCYYVKEGDIAIGQVDVESNYGSELYFFDTTTGRMKTDYYDGTYYYSDIYGNPYRGWKQINGNWHYFAPWEYDSGRYEIDNNAYYFDDGGRMLSNTSYYSSLYGKVFVINAYGIIVDEYDVPDGITYQDGIAYLFKDGEPYHGWYGENYFDYGVMAINEVIKDNGEYYLLDSHGKYVRGGWYKYYDGDWVYANAYGALCCDEWLQIGGAWYYFSDVWMVKDTIYHIEAEDKYAQFDEYGRFVKYVEDAQQTGKANSWEKKNGKWYYYNSTGAMVKGKTLYIDNAWYYFNAEGEMATDCISIDYTNFNFKFYYYSSSGARVTASNQWKFINGEWYYFNSDNSIAYSWYSVNGTQYFTNILIDYNYRTGEMIFDFELLTGYQLLNGEVYYFDASGACKGKYVGNGWLKLKSGDYVYFKDGKLLKDGIYTIGNAKYYFIEDGTMLANDWTYVGNDEYVCASASGALYGKGWHNTSNGWIYIDAFGNLATSGVYKIGSGVYFFEGGYWVP